MAPPAANAVEVSFIVSLPSWAEAPSTLASARTTASRSREPAHTRAILSCAFGGTPMQLTRRESFAALAGLGVASLATPRALAAAAPEEAGAAAGPHAPPAPPTPPPPPL